MATSKNLNGITVFVPETGDDPPGWGDNLKDTIEAMINLENILALGSSATTTITTTGVSQTLTSVSPYSTLYQPTDAFNATLNSSFLKGVTLRIENLSETYAVTLKANDGSTIYALGQKVAVLVALQNTPTTNSHWAIAYQDLTTARLDTVISDVAAISSDPTYSADTSTTQTLTSASKGQTYNPTADHDVILPATVPLAGWTRKLQNRSGTFVLTVKTSGGDTVCKIIPKAWVKFQARTTTPTAGANWMQEEAGGGWADWGGTAANFPSSGWGTVTLTNGKMRARRSGANYELKGYFELGTVGASRAKMLMPHSLSADTSEITDQKAKYGLFHQVVSAGPTAVWAGGNISGLIFYHSTDGANYLEFGVTTTSWNMDLANVNAIFGSLQGCWIEASIPISGWAIG